MDTIYLKPTDPAVAALLRVTFPTAHAKDVAIRICPCGGMSLTSYWSGGQRNYHAVIKLATMEVWHVPENGSGYSAVDHVFGPAGFPLELPAPGFAVVTSTEGHYHAVTIAIHAENAAKLIPATPEISWAERVVLVATRRLKSSYAGINDYRFHEASHYTGITRQEWDAAKSSLINRKMLNAAGAITTDGRNSAGSKDLYSLKREASNAA